MIKTKAAFLEGRLFSSLLKIKVGPPKSHFCFDHVNRLSVSLNIYSTIGKVQTSYDVYSNFRPLSLYDGILSYSANPLPPHILKIEQEEL